MRHTVSTKALGKIRLNENDYASAVLQRLAILLSTFQGETVLFREFGINRRSLDRPISVARTMLVVDVTEAIMRFVPEATIVNITFEVDESRPGALMPVLEVDI